MQQALHIFRKDVRFLRIPIAVALALTAAFAWSYSVPRPNGVEHSTAILLILGWWYLAAAAVYKEAPTGDRQFWVTRPYRWTSLLAAKALFLLAFVHLPLFAADLTILAAQGFPPSLRTLIWRQIGLAALVTLPAAAIASVTRTLAALAMTAVAALTCVLVVFVEFEAARNAWPSSESVRGTAMLAVLFVTAGATLLWQYASRRTAGGRAAASAGFALFLTVMIAPPFTGWVEARNASEAPLLGSVRLVAREPLSEPFNHVWLGIAGVPEGMHAEAETVAIAGEDKRGREWRSQWAPRFSGRPTGEIRWNGETDGNGISLWLEPWCPLGKPPANLRAAVILLVSGPAVAERIAVNGRTHDTLIGRCSLAHERNSAAIRVTCWSSEYSRRAVELNNANISIGPNNFVDYMSASPVIESTVYVNMTPPPGDTVTLSTPRHVTRIRRDVEIPIGKERP